MATRGGPRLRIVKRRGVRGPVPQAFRRAAVAGAWLDRPRRSFPLAAAPGVLRRAAECYTAAEDEPVGCGAVRHGVTQACIPYALDGPKLAADGAERSGRFRLSSHDMFGRVWFGEPGRR